MNGLNKWEMQRSAKEMPCTMVKNVKNQITIQRLSLDSSGRKGGDGLY